MAATAEQVQFELVGKFERSLRAMESSPFRDEAEVHETKEYLKELKAMPAEAFKDKTFLGSIWTVLTRLVKWAFSVFKGSLRWIGEVLKSALTLVERCLHGFICILD